MAVLYMFSVFQSRCSRLWLAMAHIFLSDFPPPPQLFCSSSPISITHRYSDIIYAHATHTHMHKHRTHTYSRRRADSRVFSSLLLRYFVRSLARLLIRPLASSSFRSGTLVLPAISSGTVHPSFVLRLSVFYVFNHSYCYPVRPLSPARRSFLSTYDRAFAVNGQSEHWLNGNFKKLLFEGVSYWLVGESKYVMSCLCSNHVYHQVTASVAHEIFIYLFIRELFSENYATLCASSSSVTQNYFFVGAIMRFWGMKSPYEKSAEVSLSWDIARTDERYRKEV